MCWLFTERAGLGQVLYWNLFLKASGASWGRKGPAAAVSAGPPEAESALLLPQSTPNWESEITGDHPGFSSISNQSVLLRQEDLHV